MEDMQRLQLLLEKEISILEELHSLSLMKTEALTKDDLNRLEEIILKEEALSNSFKAIDDACSPQVQFFLRSLSTGSGMPEKFAGLVNQIREIGAKLRLNNELNQDLIRDSLNLVQFSINSILSSSEGVAGLYGASGKVETNRKKNHLLDFKG
jgi:flagellar biosynthesis/type III secretory pathway chaperone